MSVRKVIWRPFRPESRDCMAALAHLVDTMHRLDHREIYGLREQDLSWPSLLADLAAIHSSRAHLEAWLIQPDNGFPNMPIAFAGAWRKAPRLASFAFFGSARARYHMPTIISDLLARRADFARRHDIAAAEVLVLADHQAARRWMQSIGGVEGAMLRGIGRFRDDYVQMSWRF